MTRPTAVPVSLLPPKFFIKHERMHCGGYDHAGETHMRDFLAQYNAGRALTLVQRPTEESVP